MKSNQETKPRSKSNTRKVLKDFCESTSLHGYGYIYNNDSIVLKLFWLFVIFSMTGLGILLLVQNTIEFLEHEIYTTTETSSAPISVSNLSVLIFISMIERPRIYSISYIPQAFAWRQQFNLLFFRERRMTYSGIFNENFCTSSKIIWKFMRHFLKKRILVKPSMFSLTLYSLTKW